MNPQDEKSRPGQGGQQSISAAQHTTDWLNWLYGAERDDLISVCSFKPRNFHGVFGDNEKASAQAQRLDQDGVQGTYFRLTTLPSDWTPKEKGARGDAGESAYAYALGADLDLEGLGHIGVGYPKTDEDLALILKEAQVPEPTAWVHSGGGRYPFWKFSERIPASEVADLSARWHDHLIAWSEHLGWKMDNTSDLPRVYRMPGTHNRKPARGDDQPMAYVMSWDGPVYEVEALRAALADAPTPPVSAQTSAPVPAQASAPAQAQAHTSSLFTPAGVHQPGEKHLFTEEQAQAFLGKQEEKLGRELYAGNVFRAISAFVLSCVHFERDFPWMTRDLITSRIAAVAAERMGWVKLDQEDLDKIARTFKRWDEGKVEDPWHAERAVPPAAAAPESERRTRRVDLTQFLDGSYSPPQPSVGMARSDGKMLIYPERWHTIIGPNRTGKSFLALGHAIAEMQQGNTVAYAHFEESSPGGTLTRLRAMAEELSIEDISRLFVWLDCSTSWKDGEWAAEMQDIKPSFVILDGINRACTQHGWDPSDINAPGSYGAQFVTPARTVGAAVLSLGHPPKARGRETERHGFGSTAWLDDIEGVGFRLIPSKKPIRNGEAGYAMLYSVKDRYGEVEKGLEPADGKDMDGWYTVGAFWVDSTQEGRSTYGIKPEEVNEDGQRRDAIDSLGEKILEILKVEGSFKGQRDVRDKLKTSGVKFTVSNVTPALERLARRQLIVWPEVEGNKSRPGRVRVSLSGSRPSPEPVLNE